MSRSPFKSATPKRPVGVVGGSRFEGDGGRLLAGPAGAVGGDERPP